MTALLAAIPAVVWTLIAQLGGYLIGMWFQDREQAAKFQASWEDWLKRKQNEVASAAQAKASYRKQIENIKRKRAEVKKGNTTS